MPSLDSHKAGRDALYASARNRVICIVGPTASGKSALAQQVASKIGGEVVSADSMQVYRGMDIGTGKVAPDERIVAHHCIDLVDPGDPYSAALFQQDARACFHDIWQRGATPILCGGTGFYVRAAIDDSDFPKGEQVGNEVRDRYNLLAESKGAHELWLQLAERDPESAHIIPENDVKRVVRAFELLEEGNSYAAQRAKLGRIPEKVPSIWFGLAIDPARLRARIDERVDQMMSAGLVREVQGLLDAGFREGITAPQAIGYKEIVAALDGSCTMDDAVGAIKLATRRYAKRQRTWFRKERRIHWIDANALDLNRMAEEALNHVQAVCQGDVSL